MTGSDVTTEGLKGVRPGRDAITGAAASKGQNHRRKRGEQAMVEEAHFDSYYGKPVINQPVWSSPDIPGYLFLGGLAGVASLLGAGAELTGRYGLARRTKLGAAGSAGLALVALVHDLGRPERFLNMLRVFKPTSPMSVGSWVLSAYAPAAAVAALSDVSGLLRGVGRVATGAAAVLGPPLASYTAALIADTAVPAWHDGYRELPVLFVGSGASAAGGLGLLVAPLRESGPARVLGVVGAAAELAATAAMKRRLGRTAEPYDQAKAGRLMRVGKALTIAGVVATLAGRRRSRAVEGAAGIGLLLGSGFTRFGIFEAGLQSAADPSYVVTPQRERLAQRNDHSAADAGHV